MEDDDISAESCLTNPHMNLLDNATSFKQFEDNPRLHGRKFTARAAQDSGGLQHPFQCH